MPELEINYLLFTVYLLFNTAYAARFKKNNNSSYLEQI
jgi:hypothetical protein